MTVSCGNLLVKQSVCKVSCGKFVVKSKYVSNPQVFFWYKVSMSGIQMDLCGIK